GPQKRRRVVVLAAPPTLGPERCGLKPAPGEPSFNLDFASGVGCVRERTLDRTVFIKGVADATESGARRDPGHFSSLGSVQRQVPLGRRGPTRQRSPISLPYASCQQTRPRS